MVTGLVFQGTGKRHGFVFKDAESSLEDAAADRTYAVPTLWLRGAELGKAIPV